MQIDQMRFHSSRTSVTPKARKLLSMKLAVASGAPVRTDILLREKD
jgi:hypothetical protein